MPFLSFNEVFSSIVDQYPRAIAIEDRGVELSYQELLSGVMGFAETLQDSGVKAGDTILLHMDKSADYIIALLACWHIGAVFSPLDRNLPNERKEYIIKDSGANFVVAGTSEPCFGPELILFKRRQGRLLAASLSASDSAYLIYTSGSTGEPKGVELGHAGLVTMLQAQIQAFNLRVGSRSLFMLSICFDASLSDIGTALLSGGTLVIESPCRLQAFELLKTIADKQITYVDMPPSLLRILSAKDKPCCLKTIVVGGEVCDAETIRKWAGLVNLINVYGPTEATICTSLSHCLTDWGEALIGQPLPGVSYRISKDGELLISGACLAKGYINKPDLSSKKFFYEDNQRWYASGDKVCLNEDGEYEFLGRLDRQVKLQGRLVELHEVEAALLSLDPVTDCHVLKTEKAARSYLVAYIVSDIQDIKIMRTALKRALPEWMCPAKMVFLDSLPRNHTGKIDTADLRKLCGNECHEANDSLEGLFFDYLGESFAEDEDFLDVGFDSFALMEVSAAAIDKGMVLSPALLSEYRTLSQLKRALSYEDLSSRMCADDLRKIAEDEFSKLNFVNEVQSDNRCENIFLTGASGSLGSQVLTYLLKTRHEIKVFCLLRCSNESEGFQKIFQKTSILHEYRDRIRVIPGDITKPLLGLNTEFYLSLSENMDTVFHCAAEVSSLKSFKQLYAVNVGACREVLSFCMFGKRKKLNYASTLSVFVSSDQNEGSLMEDDDLSSVKELFGGYSQSKFCAERLLQKAQLTYRGIDIFRFGLLTPASETESLPQEDFLQLFIKGTVESGCRPQRVLEELQVDITPVDFAASAFVEIGLHSHGADHAWHIANSQSLKLIELYREIEKQVCLELLDYKAWAKRLSECPTSAQSATSLSLCRLGKNFDSLRTMDLFQASRVNFDCRNSLKVLNDKNIHFPLVNSALIQKYIYAARNLCS